MSFELYLENEKTFIDVHEEGLFKIINNDEQYPQLNWLWENFYNDPVICPSVANYLVHELIALRVLLEKENKHFLHTIDRIMPFFSKAYTENKRVKCASD